MNLTILYRGPLSSCNYACPYCPFAKHAETDAEHAADADALERFLDWVDVQNGTHTLSIFFTPWGEALVRRRYQKALIRLTNLAHVRKVAIQTNLSCRLDWTLECDRDKLGLWATFHPGEVDHAAFLAKCHEASRCGVRYSVGVVGMKEHQGEVAALRQKLPPEVYLWVNAYKRVADYYSPNDIQFLTAIDPLFPLNNVRHPSEGRACLTGETVFSVDGDGTMRRCHFVKSPIGNLYTPGWEAALRPRSCPNDTCGCHIGYIHMPELGLYPVFGDGLLERRRTPEMLLPMAQVSASGA
ncbi:MAG: radical SAM protein [Fibrella sp.]|nr:radical SAM protein [Armatimonadota bacterium]